MKKSHSQVAILFVDDTNLWEGLGEDNDVTFTLEKGQQGVNIWGSNLLAVGGELRPAKCLYTVHRMKPTENGDWEYIKEKLVKVLEKAEEDQEELDELWKDMDEDELNKLDAVDAPFTVPLIDGDVAAIKRLANDESVTNLGLQVQPDGKCALQLKGARITLKIGQAEPKQATYQLEECDKANLSNSGPA